MRWLAAFFILILAYVYWSYFLTDPNLVFTSWPVYWNWQNHMWSIYTTQPILVSGIFVGLMSCLTVVYLQLVQQQNQRSLNNTVLSQLGGDTDWRRQLSLLLLVSVPLLFAYNALSHDVFNYIFNAKMVLVYEHNPHQSVALDFPQDDWLRFMHNVHTPAPYWYGWTAWSLLPYLLGMGKFSLTWFIFKLFSLLSVVGLFWSVRLLYHSIHGKPLPGSVFALVFFNPLLLIELVGNAHNDGWLLVPAVLGMSLFWQAYQNRQQHKPWVYSLAGAVIMILLSASTKYVTLVLFPVMLAWWLSDWQQIGKLKQQVLRQMNLTNSSLLFTLVTFALFVPLLTARSQQFHPWYLTWVLVWLPFIDIRWLRWCILGLGLSSLFRYYPWLSTGGFDGVVLIQQKTITWSGIALAMCGFCVVLWKQAFRRKSL